MTGAASLTCSTVLPLMIASSSHSRAQPSLSTLKTIGSPPRFCAAICVDSLVRILGLRNNIPTRRLAPRLLSLSGSALYASACCTRPSMSAASCAEMKFLIILTFGGDLFLNCLKEGVGILLPERQRRQQPDCVRLRFTGKYALTE